MQSLLVYVTMPSSDIGKKIGQAIIEEKLAACVNLVGPVWSCFQWKGECSEDSEYICIFKTTRTLYATLEKRIVELHPYETPCIVAFSIEQGLPAFLSWVKESVAD